MIEDPIIIKMNISRYQAMVKRVMDGEGRSIVQRLLADAEANMLLATDLRTQQKPPTEGQEQPYTGVLNQEKI
jgi:hypothetical protein